jgi:hypothetical protein
MFLASRLWSATVRPLTDFAWAKAKQSVMFYAYDVVGSKFERWILLRLLRRLRGTALAARPNEEVCIGVCF